MFFFLVGYGWGRPWLLLPFCFNLGSSAIHFVDLGVSSGTFLLRDEIRGACFFGSSTAQYQKRFLHRFRNCPQKKRERFWKWDGSVIGTINYIDIYCIHHNISKRHFQQIFSFVAARVSGWTPNRTVLCLNRHVDSPATWQPRIIQMTWRAKSHTCCTRSSTISYPFPIYLSIQSKLVSFSFSFPFTICSGNYGAVKKWPFQNRCMFLSPFDLVSGLRSEAYLWQQPRTMRRKLMDPWSVPGFFKPWINYVGGIFAARSCLLFLIGMDSRWLLVAGCQQPK